MALTVAPGTAALVLSVICPVIVARKSCPSRELTTRKVRVAAILLITHPLAALYVIKKRRGSDRWLVVGGSGWWRIDLIKERLPLKPILRRVVFGGDCIN